MPRIVSNTLRPILPIVGYPISVHCSSTMLEICFQLSGLKFSNCSSDKNPGLAAYIALSIATPRLRPVATAAIAGATPPLANSLPLRVLGEFVIVISPVEESAAIFGGIRVLPVLPSELVPPIILLSAAAPIPFPTFIEPVLAKVHPL